MKRVYRFPKFKTLPRLSLVTKMLSSLAGASVCRGDNVSIYYSFTSLMASTREIARLALVIVLPYGAISTACAEVPRFAYVANSYDSTLSEFIIDNRSGLLRPNGHVATGKFPSSVLVHSSGKYVYVAQQTGMKIIGFAVNPVTGRLTALPDAPYDPKVISPFWMASDSAGKFLYLAGRNSKNIGAMAINARTGALTSIKGAPYPGGQLPRSVTVSPSGQFVYMININDDTVSGYHIDPVTGALSNLPGSPFVAGDSPQFMAIHPNGKFAFLTNWNSRSILTYNVDPTSGFLQHQAELALETKVYPFGIGLDPSGRHLYATNWFGGVMGFSVNVDNGALTAIPGSPFNAKGKLPTQIMLETSGQFAYTPNYESHDVTTYSVDASTGALTALGTTWSRPGPRAIAIISGDRPVEFQPQSIYVTNAADNTVSVYRVDSLSGELKLVTTFPVGSVPSALTTNSTGRFLYVVSSGAGTISSYQVDEVTGLPKEIPGSLLKTRDQPQSITVDYNDHYAYVANGATKTMSVYAIDAQSGVLKELTKADVPYLEFPRPAGSEPRAVVLHPAERFAYVLDAIKGKVIVYSYYGNGPLAVEPSAQYASFDLAKNPVALAADPRGKFLYSAHGSINALGIYSIDVLTGEIKAVPGSPFPVGTSPAALAVHPGGQFVYVANKGSNNVTVYRTDTAQSRFVQVGQVKTGSNPVAISVEGSGRFAYVVNEGSNTISIFAIDAASGMLKEAGTIPTGAKPNALTVFTAIR